MGARYKLSGETSYRQISWSLAAASLAVRNVGSLSSFTSVSAAVLQRCLPSWSNEVILSPWVSWLPIFREIWHNIELPPCSSILKFVRPNVGPCACVFVDLWLVFWGCWSWILVGIDADWWYDGISCISSASFDSADPRIAGIWDP